MDVQLISDETNKHNVLPTLYKALTPENNNKHTGAEALLNGANSFSQTQQTWLRNNKQTLI